MTDRPMMARQGDVLLIQVPAPPADARPVAVPTPEAPRTVALGEVTGHGHGWDADDGVALLETPDGVTYVENPRALPMRHGLVTATRIADLPAVEHRPLRAPTLAEVRPQVEYAEQDIRQVMD